MVRRDDFNVVETRIGERGVGRRDRVVVATSKVVMHCLRRSIYVNNTKWKMQDIQWLVKAVDSDVTPAFLSEFRDWTRNDGREQPALKEVDQGWQRSAWTLH